MENNKKSKMLWAVVIVLILLVLGKVFWLFKEGENKEVAKDNSSEFVLSASMSCTDGTHFIAEFPNENEVQIFIDGVATATLPRVAGDGQVFENNTEVYVFAGEEAIVTSKESGGSTTCSQPLDPNNAPVNFGDKGEGAGTQQADISPLVSTSILGKWQSTEDSKFVREFSTGGKMIDIYDGKKIAEDTWVAFSKEGNPSLVPATYTLEPGTVYLKVQAVGPDSEALYFKVLKVTPEELEMVYMAKGNTLKFKKI